MSVQSLLEVVRVRGPEPLYRLITKWLDNEDGTLVSDTDFPFNRFGEYTEFNGFNPRVYRSEQSFPSFHGYKSIYWSSLEFRRGICIFVENGAWVGFSESGNGTTVLMTLVSEYDSEYERIVKPIVHAYKTWLDEFHPWW